MLKSSLYPLQGEKSFFLLPGEKLEQGIQDVFILGEDEGVILKANEAFNDVDEKEVIKMFLFVFKCKSPILPNSFILVCDRILTKYRVIPENIHTTGSIFI